MATGGINFSKEFFELLKAVGESKSKQEEDRIILREIATLKKKLETSSSSAGPSNAISTFKSMKTSRPGVNGGSICGVNNSLSNKKKAKEFLVRMLYVEMLGHDASLGSMRSVS